MRKFKRAMALTLVTAMAAASFVGCSKNSSSGSAAANNATKEVVTDASGKRQRGSFERPDRSEEV